MKMNFWPGDDVAANGADAEVYKVEQAKSTTFYRMLIYKNWDIAFSIGFLSLFWRDLVGFCEIKSSDRLKNVIEFSRSEEFDSSIALALISAIPRWGFAQSMESRLVDANRPRGVARAVAKFVDLTRKILSGRDLVAEFFNSEIWGTWCFQD